MARMHGKGKGKSGSMRPYNIEYPEHIEKTHSEIKDIIIDMAKKGNSPQIIGKNFMFVNLSTV